MSEETVKKQQSRTLQRSRVCWRSAGRGSCSFSGDMEVETLASVPMVKMPGDKLQW